MKRILTLLCASLLLCCAGCWKTIDWRREDRLACYLNGTPLYYMGTNYPNVYLKDCPEALGDHVIADVPEKAMLQFTLCAKDGTRKYVLHFLVLRSSLARNGRTDESECYLLDIETNRFFPAQQSFLSWDGSGPFYAGEYSALFSVDGESRHFSNGEFPYAYNGIRK